MELNNDNNNNNGDDDELSLGNGSSLDSAQKKRMSALEEDNRRLRERLAALKEDEPPSNQGSSSATISEHEEAQGQTSNTDTHTVVPDSQFAGDALIEATAASQSVDMDVDDDPPSDLTTEQKKEQHLDAIERAFNEAFPVDFNVYYDSGRALSAQMNDLAKQFGFVVCLHGTTASCNRAARSKADDKALQKLKDARLGPKRIRTTIKCGCEFHCKITFIKNSKTYQEKFPDAPKGALRITKVNYRHSNGCFPCTYQFAIQKKVSGKDAKEKKQRNTMTKDIGSDLSDHQSKIGDARRKQMEQEKECKERRMTMEEHKVDTEEKCNLMNALVRAQIETEKAKIETEKAKTKQVQSQTRLSYIEERKKLIQARTELLNEGASKEDVDTLLPLTFSSGQSD